MHLLAELLRDDAAHNVEKTFAGLFEDEGVFGVGPTELEAGGEGGDPDFANGCVWRNDESGFFEEPEEARFVVSPNTPVREIWISALSTSFKLSWSDSKNAFVLEKTGESLLDVMSRVVSQQLGQQVHL